MANPRARLKPGMGGSRGGRSRWERTEVLKTISKKARRLDGKEQVHEAIEPEPMDTGPDSDWP